MRIDSQYRRLAVLCSIVAFAYTVVIVPAGATFDDEPDLPGAFTTVGASAPMAIRRGGFSRPT